MCSDTDAVDALRRDSTGSFGLVPGQVSSREPDSRGVTVMVNSKTDSDLIIDDVSIMNLMAPGGDVTAGPSAFSLFTTEMKMKIMEPRGLQFMNYIRRTHKAYGKEGAGVIWALQVQFVGHNDQFVPDGSVGTGGGPLNEDTLKTIVLEFHLVDLQAQFTVAGVQYDLAFMGAANGATRIPQTDQVIDSVALEYKADKQIGTALKDLQKNINDNYDKVYKKATEELRRQTGTTNATPGAIVRYAIDPGEYKEVLFDQNPAKRTSQGNTEKERPPMQPGRNSKLDTFILKIVGESKEVQKEATGEGDPRQRKYVPNVVSVQLSGQAAKREGERLLVDVPDGGYLMVYKLKKRELPLTLNELIERGGAQKSNAVAGRDYIEFDYFFTGKNIDIIDLDLRMNMAIAFVYSITTTVNENAQTTEENSDAAHRSDTVVTGSTQDLSTRAGTPFYPGRTVKSYKGRNKLNATRTVNYYQALAKQAGMEMLEANMTIVGNPALLANLNTDPVSLIREEQNPNGTPLENDNMPNSFGDGVSDVNLNWQIKPGFVKVNIKHQVQGEDDSSTDPRFESRDFWYQDLYYMLGIESKFSGGKFTQDLMMMSIPFEPNESTTDDDRNGTLEVVKGVSSRASNVAANVGDDEQAGPAANFSVDAAGRIIGGI